MNINYDVNGWNQHLEASMKKPQYAIKFGKHELTSLLQTFS